MTGNLNILTKYMFDREVAIHSKDDVPMDTKQAKGVEENLNRTRE
jgi:hypothetical protein